MLAGAWGVKNSTWKEYGWRDEMEKDLRIAVFGQKRLSREGGVEIVVKELCTRMAQQGWQNMTMLVKRSTRESVRSTFQR